MKKRQTQEVKTHIAKLLIEEGRKATDLAYEIGVSSSTVRQWGVDYREKQARLANPEGELYTFSELEKSCAKRNISLKSVMMRWIF